MQAITSVPIDQIYPTRQAAVRAIARKRRTANRLGFQLRYTSHQSHYGGWFLVVTTADGTTLLCRRGTSHWC